VDLPDPAVMLSALADRNCLVAFAAMVSGCDPAVRKNRMGYDDTAGARSVSYITATGVAKATGLSVQAADLALRTLEAVGLAVVSPRYPGGGDYDSWRTATDVLAGYANPSEASASRPELKTSSP
jgi:hypothetical protein